MEILSRGLIIVARHLYDIILIRKEIIQWKT